jgi:hypothetical protein
MPRWWAWAETIVRYPCYQGQHDARNDVELLAHAYRAVPDAVIALVRAGLLDSGTTDLGALAGLWRLEGCWDDRFATAMMDLLNDPSLQPHTAAGLVRDGLRFAPTTARWMAESTLREPISNGHVRSRVLAIARELALGTEDGAWQIVWPLLSGDAAFGRELLGAIIEGFPVLPNQLHLRLTEGQLANLFAWIETNYPLPEPRPRYGFYEVNTGHCVEQFQRNIVGALIDRGTSSALAALERLRDEFPRHDRSDLAWCVARAAERLRERTWTRPTASEVLALAEDRQRRLVEGAADLVDLVCETLERLQARLRGEIPEIEFLWNAPARDGEVWFPKDESALANWVAARLRDELSGRGIVVAREVEIRRPLAGAEGQRTDIHVDAFRRGRDGQRRDTVHVIVEVNEPKELILGSLPSSEGKGGWCESKNDADRRVLVRLQGRDGRGIVLSIWP